MISFKTSSTKLWFLAIYVILLPSAILAQTQKPNIIFILTNDQRFNALGYVGNKIVYTPEMDKLAKQGTYFKNSFATIPNCTSTRTSIISGLYKRTHKYNFRTPLIRD